MPPYIPPESLLMKLRKQRLFTGIFILIVCIALSSFTVGQGANAGSTVYLESVGQTTAMAGFGALSFSISAAFARIISGPVTDQYGRRKVMVAGAVIMTIGTAAPLIANAGAAFIVWRIFQGVGFSAVTTASATAAADVVPKARLGEGIGYYGLGQALAMSIGPAAAIFLVDSGAPSNLYIGLTACAIASLCLSVICGYEKHPERLPETSEYRMSYQEEPENTHHKVTLKSLCTDIFEPCAMRGTLPLMFIATSFGFGIFFIGALGLSLGVASSGIFFTVGAVSMVAVRMSSGKFMDTVAPIKIMAAAVVSGLVAYGMLFACSCADGADMTLLFYAAGIPYGLSLGIALPVNQAVSVKLTPPERWGAANALFLLGNDVAIGVSSLAWGLINATYGFSASIVAVMVFISASFVVALICYPKE